MDQSNRVYFPFTAIVGMDNAKLALLVNAVNPLIGGVVLAGDKGTGKSTLVRAFAQVLPKQPVAKGCQFNCNPFNPLEMCDYHAMLWSRGERIDYELRKIRVVDLPLNATPDRVVGSIDVEQTIKSGVVVFKPGLLAEANRNVLYIDEVNLLEDYIADLILDAAASGWNIVEREGISFKHPARFVLVGSMNPEEGMLRPQLLDRFGLYVPVEASADPNERIEIVERVEEFAKDPISFYRKWESYEKQLEERIARAKEIVKDVAMDRDLLKLVATTIIKLGIKTHRAEIVVTRTAKAIAALDNRLKVNINDVVKAMELALRHRLKSKPFEEQQKKLDEVFRELAGEKPERGESEARSGGGNAKSGGNPGAMGSGANNRIEARLGNFDEKSASLPIDVSLPRIEDSTTGFGRGSRNFKSVGIATLKGVAIDAIPPVKHVIVDVDIPATIRASVAYKPSVPIAVDLQNIRVRVRKERIPVLNTIILDTSSSMTIGKRISLAKHILKKLIEDSYVARTYVSLVIFRGLSASTISWPTRNVELVYKLLDEVPVGGSTPFTSALAEALKHLKAFKTRFSNAKLVAHILSDGGANIFLSRNPINEILDLAEEYRKLNAKVIAYNTQSNYLRILPDYLKIFVDAVNGTYLNI
ncbi:VWA domain-containing protein [Ignisphaera sp. 4213-co]|uniref:VWA domain-containing protein n=1 Tax=Ignisphaera cupida TaxID=3050454 RepID=A0ABD4Z6H1_9CREN|nr:ATP-binding protein [Ignisphaera sp. 4213-co]MDK6028916.1 VWA domain-containing protein [Ignisphaera sp. 4213-co]